MELDYNGFNTRLEELIDYSGKTHKEIAAESGIPKNVIDSYTSKNGSSNPSAANAVKLASVLHTTVEYLMTGNNPTAVHSLNMEQRNLVESIDSLQTRDKTILKSIIQTFINTK